MNREDLDHRFAYHAPRNEEAVRRHEMVRDECGKLARMFDAELPEGREKALVITHLEEAMMWANAAIARAHEV